MAPTMDRSRRARVGAGIWQETDKERGLKVSTVLDGPQHGQKAKRATEASDGSGKP